MGIAKEYHASEQTRLRLMASRANPVLAEQGRRGSSLTDLVLVAVENEGAPKEI